MFHVRAQIHLIINFIFFQIGWFCALYLQDESVYVLSICFLVMLLTSENIKKNLLFLLVSFPVVFAIEYTMLLIDLISYNSSFLPIWLIMLWALLLLTFNGSMKTLSKQHVFVSAAVFALLAPISYLSGAHFEALKIHKPILQFYLEFSAIWFIFLTCIFNVYKFIFLKAGS